MYMYMYMYECVYEQGVVCYARQETRIPSYNNHMGIWITMEYMYTLEVPTTYDFVVEVGDSHLRPAHSTPSKL